MDEKRFIVIQHIKTIKYIQDYNRPQLKPTEPQQLVSTDYTKKKCNKDLCEAMWLAVERFRKFLKLYTKKEISKKATLRKGLTTNFWKQ